MVIEKCTGRTSLSRKINLMANGFSHGFKGNSAIIGIEGVPDDPRGHYISFKDVTWAHKK